MTALSVVAVGGGSWIAKLLCSDGERPDWLTPEEWDRQLAFGVSFQWGRDGGNMVVIHEKARE